MVHKGTEDLSSATGFTRQGVASLSDALAEPGWLVERRLQAFDVFEKLDLPDPKGEEWRYVDVRSFDFERFSPPRPAHERPGLPAELERQGVVLADFRTAAGRYGDL